MHIEKLKRNESDCRSRRSETNTEPFDYRSSLNSEKKSPSDFTKKLLLSGFTTLYPSGEQEVD